MPERYEGDARKMMALARREVERLGHDTIGTEHLLLALVAAGGPAVEILGLLGVDPEEVRREAGLRAGRGNAAARRGQLPMTHEVKEALGRAVVEARALGHGAIRAVHVLLGLAGDAGAAGEVLRAMGVTPDAARQKARELEGSGSGEPSRQ